MGWKLVTSPAICQIDNTTAHRGNFSIKISCPYHIVWGFHIIQEVTFEPGISYLVSFWYKGKDIVSRQEEGAVVVGLQYYDTAEGKYKAFHHIRPVPKSRQVPSDWQSATKKITVPSNAELGKGLIELKLHAGTGTLWFDDVVVKPVP